MIEEGSVTNEVLKWVESERKNILEEERKLLEEIPERIGHVLKDGVDFNDEHNKRALDKAAEVLKIILEERLDAAKRLEQRRGLRLSAIGTHCPRKLWFSVNNPDAAEELEPEVRLKFLYGDIIEVLVLFLLELAGYEVSDQQKEVAFEGVVGHIDAILEGRCVVDVKSASTFSMRKFRDGISDTNDPFGYKSQLYAYASALDMPCAAFIAVDKQHGKIIVDTHNVTKNDTDVLRERIELIRNVCQSPTPPPIPYKFLGNTKKQIPVECRYCQFKFECYPTLTVYQKSDGSKEYYPCPQNRKKIQNVTRELKEKLLREKKERVEKRKRLAQKKKDQEE